MEIIHENEYVYKMNDEIEPYLATHRQEGYIPVQRIICTEKTRG